MPDDLERQLEAFGRTLREATGEPIERDIMGSPTSGAHRATRRWALLGAAACVVVAVVGLGLAAGDRASAPSAPSTVSTPFDGATIPAVPGPDAGAVPADPLALERDGWELVQRTAAPFSMSADELACGSVLDAIDGVEQVHDILTPPGGGGLDLDLQILDVGSIERGNALAEAVMAVGRCLGEADGIGIETGALSSVRATWFRAGPEFALVTIVGEGSRSIVLEIEGAPFDDDLIGELAHRADDFLRGEPVAGSLAPTGPIDVTDGTHVGERQVEPDPGEVKLWIGNQSFEDDPVAIAVEIDGFPVVDDSFAVEGQHNWFSFMVSGLEPGEHTITASSDTGASFEGTFTLPADEARWMVIDYWYDVDATEGRHFTFRESDEPIYFA